MRYSALWGMVLLLSPIAASADTAAGVAAFKNKDYATAYREWKTAADTGVPEAEFDLGLLYSQGLGVRRDLTEATRWYRKAAEQGNAMAQYTLGACTTMARVSPGLRVRAGLVSPSRRAGLCPRSSQSRDLVWH